MYCAQEHLYRRILKSAQVVNLLLSTGQMSCVLPAISALRKVCNHPDLLWNRAPEDGDDERCPSLASDLTFPEDYAPNASPSSCGGWHSYLLTIKNQKDLRWLSVILII
jgi:hypothetical protein